MIKQGRTDKQWSSRSIGSRLQHNIFYLLIRLRARWIVFALLRAVVCYYVIFRPSLRNRADYYLSRRFPGLRGVRRLRATYLLDLNLGQVLVDRAALGILGPEGIEVDFPDRERLRELVREGKGLILMTAHVGGWQVAMATLRFLNVPINLLVHREEGDIALHYFEHRGGSSPFRIIDPAEELGGMLAMMAVLKKGEVLCTMGDRVFGSSRNTVAVCFLGADIRVPFSAFKIASATGSPIAVMFSVRQASGRYELMLDRVIRVPADLGRSGTEFACYAGEFVQGMEAYVKDHPFQFFNFFDMWERDDLSGTEPRTSSLEKTEGKRR